MLHSSGPRQLRVTLKTRFQRHLQTFLNYEKCMRQSQGEGVSRSINGNVLTSYRFLQDTGTNVYTEPRGCGRTISEELFPAGEGVRRPPRERKSTPAASSALGLLLREQREHRGRQGRCRSRSSAPSIASDQDGYGLPNANRRGRGHTGGDPPAAGRSPPHPGTREGRGDAPGLELPKEACGEKRVRERPADAPPGRPASLRPGARTRVLGARGPGDSRPAAVGTPPSQSLRPRTPLSRPGRVPGTCAPRAGAPVRAERRPERSRTVSPDETHPSRS